MGRTISDPGPYPIQPTSALIAFESAARHGNFSRAEMELGTSQPAVSHHMARLETQLGARLFGRSRTGVSLAEAGSHYRDVVAAGRGLVLGWRHLIGRYVESGALVALGEGFVETGRCFTAALTPEGRQRPLASACLAFFVDGAG